MLYTSLHNRWLRLIFAVIGQMIAALALKLFIVPLNLYTGGIMGLCQLFRTFLQSQFGLSFGTHDIAGILYFLINVPILLLAYKTLGKSLVFKTLVCTVSYSLFYSIISLPQEPIIHDYLTACMLGGILAGIGTGLSLTCGGSGGGLDIVGLCLSKRGSAFTVGKFSLSFNAVLYTICLILFSPEVAIYSVIYNFIYSMVLDRVHQQNVSVQALIFTRVDEAVVSQFITDTLDRGVTRWTGTGGYTGEDVHVLCVCLSKFEIEELLHSVHTIDPNAFLMVQEGVRVYGNFRKKVG